MSKKLTAAVAVFAMIFSMLPQVFAADLAQADADALTLSVIAKYDGGTNFSITVPTITPNISAINIFVVNPSFFIFLPPTLS